ncbi:MAG: PQQ-dependent sugar dehydrogenase [Pirellulales bacterium]
MADHSARPLLIVGLFVLAFGGLAAWKLALPRDARRAPAAASTPASRVAPAVPVRTAAQPPVGLPHRVPWTRSNLRGTPDPPAPFVAADAFPQVRFRNPVALAVSPGESRLWVAEQGGKLFSFPLDSPNSTASLALDVNTLLSGPRPAGIDNSLVQGLEALYGLTFHPRFAENRYCYLTYVVRGEPGRQLPAGTRVSRFTVTTTDPPTLDPASEQIVITWLQGGHNGGCLAFGPDGCLYVSTGDGGFANPPDGLQAGQDVSNLLSSILRIDVDHPTADRPYSIPSDNPFVSLPGARGEIWCYGLRNPWKMSFDRATGDLWVADVGWELWELVYRVQKGGNYGWSVVEGRQPVHPERPVGPTPILPPTLEIPHTDGVSITGGFVYRGRQFPELVGQYLFGDWETRRIWSSRWDPATQTASPPVDVVEPTVRLVAFAEDPAGELLLLDYDAGSVLRLARNERFGSNPTFPTRLSDTGLFASTAELIPAPGVVEFSVNVEQWADGATARRYVAIPGDSSVEVLATRRPITGSMFSSRVVFPPNSVLVKTLSLPADEVSNADKVSGAGPHRERRVETQVLHFDGQFWRGYAYAWNAEQTDAELVGPTGADLPITPQRSWHFASRVECARCHNQWAEYALAFQPEQLNRDHDYPECTDNQLRALSHAGLLQLPWPTARSATTAASAGPPTAAIAHAVAPSPASRPADWYASQYPRFAPLNDPAASLDQRVRSYLHVNCAHCHRVGGGGTAAIELREELPLEATQALDVRPTQGTFDLPDARILAPGDPYRSTLFLRMAKIGAGRMPHLGSDVVDERAVAAVGEWIRQLPLHTDDARKIRELRNLVDTPSGSASPTASPQEERRRQERAQRRATLIADLLSSTSRALYLARSLQTDPLPPPILQELLAAARQRESPVIRDLFESWQPPEQRTQRLGNVIRPEQILALPGDAARGQRLFFDTPGVQCKSCHRIDGVGSQLGPDLSRIGVKYSPRQLLDQILEPSKIVEPRYVSYVVTLDDGRRLTGLLVDRTPEELVIRDAKDQLLRLPASEVEAVTPQRQSLMPDLQLRDLSAEQVADLLAYLASRKAP